MDKYCLYIFQCVWRICKTQGKLEWVAKVRENDEQLKSVIDHYRKHRLAIYAAENKKSSTWSLVTCMEYIRASTEVEQRDEGELMCERRFCEWSTDRCNNA